MSEKRDLRNKNIKRKPINNRPINKPINKKQPPAPKVNKPKPTRRQNNNFSRFIVVFFIFFCIYGFGLFLKLMTSDNVDSMVLKSIDVTKNDAYQGIIIRDEKVYNTEVDGYLTLIAKDLEKVKKGSLLYSVSQETDTTLDDELSKVEDDIFNLQTFREEYSNYRKDIDFIQGNIQKGIDTFSYNSYGDINALNDDIRNNLETRKQIVFADQRITDSTKIDAKENLESKIDSNSTKVYADDGGIVSYNFDGLEATINPEVMNDFTIEQTKMDSTFKHNENIQIAKGAPILRIVKSNTWYIGTYIDKKEGQSLKVSDNRSLFINVDGTFKEIPARVKYISENVDKNVYVIFELRSYMQEFMNKRNVEVALKTLTYMNIKVPKSAIATKEYLKIPVSYVVETDKKVVIKKLEDGTTQSSPITIEGKDATGEYYYIDKSKNDLLVGGSLVNPNNAAETYLIPEITNISGVYKINNGIANFEKIEINTEIDSTYEESDFVYILPSSTLKEYDRILTHADSISEGEIIK